MDSIYKEYRIKAKLNDVWKALVDPKVIEVWSGTKALMKEKVGYKFKLWNGDIHGKNLEVEKNLLLKQEWFGGDWVDPSIAIITLEKDGDFVTLKLDHQNIPKGQGADFDKGWDEYYFGAIKELLES